MARPAHARRRWRRWGRAGGLFVVLLIGLCGSTVGVLWPLTPGVGDAGRRIAARLAAVGDPVLAALPSPDRVGQAVLATEDSRFYSEPGIDPIGIARAALGALRGSGDQGGATIDQQLAKVLYTPESTSFPAEVEQVILALKFEVHYSKATILRMYLAAVYFGHGCYGLPAAAEGYFGLPPGSLSWGQASLLAGLVQAPSAYDPLAHLALARARQRHVLDRLVATHVLSRAQADIAYAEPLGLR
ncbi:MAG: transglycosylase domain-containing protein [Mycobacteriales bacterium]